MDEIIEKLKALREHYKLQIDAHPSSMSNNRIEGIRKGLKIALDLIEEKNDNSNK